MFSLSWLIPYRLREQCILRRRLGRAHKTGTTLDDLCTIMILKGFVKGRSKDSGSRPVGKFVPDTHNLLKFEYLSCIAILFKTAIPIFSCR